MKIFEQVFGHDVFVVTITSPTGTVVRAFTKRQDPTWLHKPKGLAGNTKIKTETLREEMLKMITLRPGEAPGFYCRLSQAEGGCKGSQERKEKMLAALLQEGLVRKEPLPQPVGRKTHAIYPA